MQDAYFYSLVYDPHQKTLLADKGEIRVGPRYQAEIPDKFEERKLPPVGALAQMVDMSYYLMGALYDIKKLSLDSDAKIEFDL